MEGAVRVIKKGGRLRFKVMFAMGTFIYIYAKTCNDEMKKCKLERDIICRERVKTLFHHIYSRRLESRLFDVLVI